MVIILFGEEKVLGRRRVGLVFGFWGFLLCLTAFFVEAPAVQYTLTISVDGFGTTDPAPGPHFYDAGTIVPVDAIPDSGYMLDHWELDTVNVGAADPYSVTMNQDHTLKAFFVTEMIVQYDLTISVVGSGTTSPASGVYTYDEGAEVSVDAIPDSGWMLDYWELDDVDVGSADPYSVTINADHNLTAFFVEVPVVQQTATIETELFSYAIYVPAREVRATTYELTKGTRIRIAFNASESIDFFCQDSNEYFMSSSHAWSLIWYHWSEETANMNRTYTIPTTDTWYFTLANYEYDGVEVYNIALYQLEIYEIHVEADKEFYNKGEQVTLTAKVYKDDQPMSGVELTFQVLDSHGNTIFGRSSKTDVNGQTTGNFNLPNQEGTYTATAQTVVVRARKAIEDSVTIAIDETSPITSHDYDWLWHNTDFAITLTGIDNVTDVAETFYRINNGSIQSISTNGQPLIALESTNNILEYWSVDKAGNEELPHKILTGIKLDKTAPMANAGVDQTVNEDTLVTFDGSASTDENGIASYTWTFTDVTPQTLNGKDPTYTFATPGNYTVTLTVKDAAGNAATHSITVIVLEAEAPPAEAFPMWILGAAVAIVAIRTAVATIILWKKRK